MVTMLCVGQVFGPICNRLFELDNNGTCVVVGKIGINVEQKIVVWVCHEKICIQNYVHMFEGLICFWGSARDLFTRFARKRLKQFLLLRTHQPVCIDSTKKTLHFLRNSFFRGLRPVGVNQYPIQSVSLTAHSHLKGLTVNPFASNKESILSYKIKFSSQDLEKRRV